MFQSNKPILAWADLLKSDKNTNFPLKFYKPKEGEVKNCIDMHVELPIYIGGKLALVRC